MTTIGISSAGAVPATRTSWSRWAPISGIVFGPLLAASATLTAGMPEAKNAAKAQEWAVKHTGLIKASSIMTAAAVIIGLYFLTLLHSHLAGREGGWMGTTFLVGTVVFAMAGASIAGLNATLGSDAKHLSTGSVQLMTSLDQNFNYFMTCIGLALMYLAAGYLIRRTGLLPGWLAIVSWVFAFLAATLFLGFVALLGSVLWMIVVGAILTARQPVEK